jgi:hypothetical protein
MVLLLLLLLLDLRRSHCGNKLSPVNKSSKGIQLMSLGRVACQVRSSLLRKLSAQRVLLFNLWHRQKAQTFPIPGVEQACQSMLATAVEPIADFTQSLTQSCSSLFKM